MTGSQDVLQYPPAVCPQGDSLCRHGGVEKRIGGRADFVASHDSRMGDGELDESDGVLEVQHPAGLRPGYRWQR
jgi:hypothetical protein